VEWIRQTVAYWQAGGALLIPIALVSVAIWAYLLRTRADFTVFAANCRRAEECIAALSPVELCRLGSDALATRTLMEEGSRRVSRLSRDLVVLAALTAVAPLLGLLGTVEGMIGTFRAVAGGPGDAAHSAALGISRALITTQLGLVVAIPGVFGLARMLRARERLRDALDNVGLHLLRARYGNE